MAHARAKGAVLAFGFCLAASDGSVDARKVDSTYQLALAVYVTLQNGRHARQFLDLSGPTGHTTVKVPSKPKSVSVNDNFEVLAFVEKE